MGRTGFPVPIVFVIFNRPDTTSRVFEAIRQLRPATLLIIADGPRREHPDDSQKCAATRRIVEQIDWKTEVLHTYAEENLGCGLRLASGITWAFQQVEEAIILEDDCLPHPSFFPYCAALLEHYRNDQRIMHISGSNFQFERRSSSFSYYFSRFAHVWGWASWRRAWQHFDYNMTCWPEVRQSALLQNWLGRWNIVRKWRKSFDYFYGPGKRATWDYQWQLACWLQHALSIVPATNLVANIGFNAQATHTNQPSPFAAMPVHALTFPLQHPPYLIRNHSADSFTEKTLYGADLATRVKIKLNQILHHIQASGRRK
jgi:hypothetical protein